MRRFLVDTISPKNGLCSITGAEARHITRVLRMQEGDSLILMDSEGSRFEAIIEIATRKEVRVALRREIPAPPPPPVEIHLCQALLKSGAMDYLIQKASELGIAFIHPFWSERTAVRPKEDRLASRLRHWRGIAKSSTKQSDRTNIPEIAPITSFRDVVGQWGDEDARRVILWEEEGSEDLKGFLRATSPGKRFIGVVGPEGGFAREEVILARKTGFESVSLGTRLLRSETAAVVMVAIVQYEWGDLSLVP